MNAEASGSAVGQARAGGVVNLAAAGATAAARRWTSVGLFVLLFAVYSANGREIGAVDTVANTLLPVAILRGDGLTLDRFLDGARRRGELPYWAAVRGQKLISIYPVLPALMAVPLTAPQLWLLDRLSPGWEADRERVHRWLRRMAKNSAAALTALAGVLLYRLLLLLGLGSVAVLATLAVGLGSELWSVASQAAWQHGSAALLLTAALVLLARRPASRFRLLCAGLAAVAAACARAPLLIFTAALALWVLYAERRRALWFLMPAAVLGALLLLYNLHFFASVLGGRAEILATGDVVYLGAWSPQPWRGLAGTLLSPNRGLFVFTPWALLAVVYLPLTWRHLARSQAVAAALAALVPYTIIVSGYRAWWAGWSFGPRYWTDAMPMLGVLLAFALASARERSRAAWQVLMLAIVVSIAVQAVGAFCYPSSWNSSPVAIDRQPERVWDWRDTELRRCLAEGPPAVTDYPIYPDDLQERALPPPRRRDAGRQPRGGAR